MKHLNDEMSNIKIIQQKKMFEEKKQSCLPKTGLEMFKWLIISLKLNLPTAIIYVTF